MSSIENTPLQSIPARKPLSPPHPLDGEWYVSANGETYGPYVGHAILKMIAEQRIASDTAVCRVGGAVWQPAREDGVLGDLFRNLAPPPLPSLITPQNVAAAAGATVVQVTNSFAAPEPARRTVFIEDGPARPKSAGIALVLSLLLVGVGQMYNGQVGKGILMMIGCVFLWFMLLGWIVNIWSMVDAYRTATAMNDRYLRRLGLYAA